MRIQKYGILLLPLIENDIELVRNWRNLPHVKSAMLLQQDISPNMQVHWYNNLTECDHYFIISVEKNQIGVIHVKNINWEMKSGEAGILIGKEDYLKTIYPVAAVLAMMDFFFQEFKFNELTATVRSDNREILEFNLQLGYRVVNSDAVATKLRVDKVSYLNSTERIRVVLSKYSFQ